jgi:DNA-binding XRE family transcriptional regulator
MTKLQQLKKRALKNADVRKEYEALAEEFAIINQLLKMRNAAGLTQEELALRMGTQKSNICRLEKGNTNPSWATLKNYAKACGFDIHIESHPV